MTEKYSISEKLRLLASQIFAVSIVVIILISSNVWGEKAPIINMILFLIGVILASIGAMGRLWCSLYIAGYKTDKLITLGPYSMCRNPLYFFSYLGALGLGFSTESFLIPLIISIAFAIYYPYVIKSEEAKLEEIFAKGFKEYVDNVPCFLPKFTSLMEPEEYIVKPILFREHMFDAIWFIWFIGIIEIIKELHTINILPTLFNIY